MKDDPKNYSAPTSQAEKIKLSERDTLRVIDLLENPPAPTERMIRAAHYKTEIKD